MGLRQWVSAQFRHIEPNKRTRARLQPMSLPGVPQSSPYDLQRFAHDGYRKNVAIYGCVKFRATGAQHVKFLAKRPTSDGEMEELGANHPLQQLIDRPNPEQTTEDFIFEMVQHVDIGGTAYVHKVRSRMKTAPPVEIWNLRPDRMEKIPNAQGFVESYHFPKELPRSQDTMIPHMDVVEWMDGRDPLNDYYGLSKIAVLSRQGDIDNETSDFMRAVLLNAGMPAAALKYKTETPVGKAERDRIKQAWRDEYGRSQGANWYGETGNGEYIDTAVGGWGGLAVLDADVEWIRMGSNFSELDLGHIFGHTESRICVPFGVPPILIGLKVGLDRATYSNAEQAEDHYWNNTGVPLYKSIAAKLTHGLAKEFDPSAVIVADFSEVRALKEDEDARAARTSTLWEKGLIRLDEARDELGWEAAGQDEDGVDVGALFQWQIPQQTGPEPLAMNGNGVPAQLELEAERQSIAWTPMPQTLLPPSVTTTTFSVDEPSWKRLHRAADARARAIRMAVVKAITDAQASLPIQSVMNALTMRDLNRLDVLTATAWNEAAKPVLQQRLKTHLVVLFEEGAEAGDEDIEKQSAGPSEMFVEVNPGAADEWAESHIGELIAEVSDSTRKLVRELVDSMFSEGLSTREMATRIRDRLGLTRPLQARLAKFERVAAEKGFSGDVLRAKVHRFSRRLIRERAFLIAKTEGVRAVSEGQSAVWAKAQVEGILPQEQKQFWITTEDDDVCPICAPMNDQEVGLRETFTGGNGASISAPPAHPACRCARGLR